MVNVLVKHAVADYDRWKRYFDEEASTRMEYGSQGYRLYHVSSDSNVVVMLFEWDSMENARKFHDDSGVLEVMKKAGVVGEPEIYYLDEIESKTPEQPMA
jgi:quinol monooxygenase YgiN